MCYFLYIASPLTLSEVRSMLPPGLAADLAPAQVRAALQTLHPPAKTVARLSVGACSCDLVRVRVADPIADERDLRARYRRDKLSRADTIRELERHRRRTPRSEPPAGWAEALVRFVAEHGRNAGPTVYLLDFSAGESRSAPERWMTPIQCSVHDLSRRAGSWLIEGRPTLVT